MITRPAAVAGLFYPNDKNELQMQIKYFLEQARINLNLNIDRESVPQSAITKLSKQQPTALIVPHAGYIYSGLTAAHAYQQIIQYKNLWYGGS